MFAPGYFGPKFFQPPYFDKFGAEVSPPQIITAQIDVVAASNVRIGVEKASTATIGIEPTRSR